MRASDTFLWYGRTPTIRTANPSSSRMPRGREVSGSGAGRGGRLADDEPASDPNARVTQLWATRRTPARGFQGSEALKQTRSPG